MGRGRSARKAAETEFYETIDRVLGCISSDGLFVVPAQGSSARLLTFQPGRSQVTTEAGERLALSFEHWYDVVSDPSIGWRVRTEAYVYTVFGADGREALGYHYHPSVRDEGFVVVPHLHVYRDVALCDEYLPKVHLRTGRVAIEDVVELLITDFDVRPRPEYAGTWQEILATARSTFVRLRRWSS